MNEFLGPWLHWLGGKPCFQIYGKGRREAAWRVISVFANGRRNIGSRWPLWRGTCITWTADVIVVGWDFAQEVLLEQTACPAARDLPVSVAGGRIVDACRRAAAGVSEPASASEVLAHECGHTWQAIRLGPIYLPLVGSTTLFKEGANSWNRFENEASAEGLFGGIVTKSVCARLMERIAGVRQAVS